MERNGFHQAGGVGRGLGRWLGGRLGGPPGLAVHVGLFLLGATILILLNLLRSPRELWFWRPLAWWGGLLLLHAAVVVGGVVRRTEAGASAPKPIRPARTEPRIAPAFASWAQTTDTWETVEAEEHAPAPGADRQHDADVLGGATGTTRGVHGETGTGEDAAHRTPTATGRFQPNGGTGMPSAPSSTNGHARPEWVLPADVEAMWARPAAHGGATTPVPEPATATEAFPVSPDVGRGGAIRGSVPVPGTVAGWRGEPSEDVFHGGSASVDAKDPSWTRLEAAAAAWLARRDARPTPTPLPAPPAPTGTDGASSASS